MIEKANLKDAKAIHKLINFYAKKDKMLPRSLSEIYENIREYFVYKKNNKIVGCCALHIFWEDCAEIRSLAVDPYFKKRRIGSILTEACIKEAKEMGILRIFTLTVVPEFFEKLGFKRVDKFTLPMKVWSECIKCSKFTECDEVALVKSV